MQPRATESSEETTNVPRIGHLSNSEKGEDFENGCVAFRPDIFGESFLWLFQHDGAAIHRSRDTLTVCGSVITEYLQWLCVLPSAVMAI